MSALRSIPERMNENNEIWMHRDVFIHYTHSFVCIHPLMPCYGCVGDATSLKEHQSKPLTTPAMAL